MKIALLGAGRIGRVHAANVAAAGAQLVTVCDPVEEAAREVASRWGARWCTEPARALEGVDAVLVCSATDTHAPLVHLAAAAGRHVFCEKPLDVDLASIDGMLAAVRRAGVRLQVGFNRRFDPGVRSLRRLLAEKRLGDVHLVRITSRDPAPPPLSYVKVSGGIFLDMTIHDFDMARCLAGSEAVEVYAAGAVRVDPAIGEAGDVDTAVVTVRFADGTLACIDNSRKAVYGYDQRVEVFGSAGMASNGNRLADTHVRWDGEGSHGPRLMDFFMDRYAESFLAELRSFVEAVRSGGPTEVDGHDGRQAVALALAATESLRRGAPVEVR